MTENFPEEVPYRIVAEPGQSVIRYIIYAPVVLIQRWQCPPARPSPSRLQDHYIDPDPTKGAVFGTAARCDLYTAENWQAMIADVWGGSEAAYFVAHNAVEVNGDIIDERDGR